MVLGEWVGYMQECGQHPLIGSELHGLLSRCNYNDVQSKMMPHVAMSEEEIYTRYIQNWKDQLPSLRKTLEGKIDDATFEKAHDELEDQSGDDVFMETTFVVTATK